MNDEQYRKACRYRVQETLEDLAGAWVVPDEKIGSELIDNSVIWLQRTLDELRYFRGKIANAQDGPPLPGFVDERSREPGVE